MIITEHSDVPVKSRTTKKELFLYVNLCPSVKLDSLSCSIKSISLFTNKMINKRHHTVGTFPKFKEKSSKKVISTPLTYKYMTAHFPATEKWRKITSFLSHENQHK